MPTEAELARRYRTARISLLGLAIPGILSQNVSHVAVVLLADILHQFLVRKEVDPPVNCKGPGVRSWIVDVSLPFQVLQVGAPVTLDRVQLLRVWVTGKIKPELVIESQVLLRTWKPALLIG